MSHSLFSLLITALRAQPECHCSPVKCRTVFFFFLIFFLLIFNCAGSLLLGLCGLSLVAASRGYCLAAVACLVAEHGFWGVQTSVAVTPEL